MRQDIILGVAISAAIHAGILIPGFLNPNRPPIRHAAAKSPVIVLEQPPPLDPPDPEPVDSTEEAPKPIDFAPPTITDVPQAITDTSFVQPPELPRPEGLNGPKDLRTIPDMDRTHWRQTKIWDPKSLDQQPESRYRTPPQYPWAMRQSGTTGEVVIEFIVDANGNVQNAHAISSTNVAFEEPAVQAVSKWKFKPGRKGGRPVNTRMQVPISFSIHDDE